MNESKEEYAGKRHVPQDAEWIIANFTFPGFRAVQHAGTGWPFTPESPLDASTAALAMQMAAAPGVFIRCFLCYNLTQRFWFLEAKTTFGRLGSNLPPV